MATKRTVNQRLLDELTGHQIDLIQYANGSVRRVIGVINGYDEELFDRLLVAVDKIGRGSLRTTRFSNLFSPVQEVNTKAYEKAYNVLRSDLRDLVEAESPFYSELLASALPSDVLDTIQLEKVSAAQAYAAATAEPFQGRLLKEWSDSLERNRLQRISDQVRIGFVGQETIDQIVRRVRGTKAANYSDGAIDIDRRHASTIVHTAVSHYAAVTRDEFFTANKDIIGEVIWVSTLDVRTSPPCRARDRKLYTNDDKHKPIGHKYPWGEGPGKLHMNCRSTYVPRVVPFTKLGVQLDWPESTRASMDGQVPVTTSYADWIKQQSAERQDQILGPTRGVLLRKGKLELKNFYSATGAWLTITELRARNAAAFRRAGL